jgi:hypothetical protein
MYEISKTMDRKFRFDGVDTRRRHALARSHANALPQRSDIVLLARVRGQLGESYTQMVEERVP